MTTKGKKDAARRQAPLAALTNVGVESWHRRPGITLHLTFSFEASVEEVTAWREHMYRGGGVRLPKLPRKGTPL